MTIPESHLENQLIEKLRDLKYEYRPDIRGRAALERNFREKFEALNRARLTDGEFARLLDEIVTPDVFIAAKTIRQINAFTREDGTPLNYTLVNIKDWCKNTFEVVIDTVIGLPANLFYSTGIPVCILVLKKCKKFDDVLFTNAAEHFVKGKRQNQLTEEHIAKIIEAYQFRKEEPRYSRRVEMAEIEKNDFNLNISRDISAAVGEEEIDLTATHSDLVGIEETIQNATARHNEFLKELVVPPLP